METRQSTTLRVLEKNDFTERECATFNGADRVHYGNDHTKSACYEVDGHQMKSEDDRGIPKQL